MKWLDGITDAMDMNLNKLWEIVENRGVWHDTGHGVVKCQTWLSDWTNLSPEFYILCFCFREILALKMSSSSWLLIQVNCPKEELVIESHSTIIKPLACLYLSTPLTGLFKSLKKLEIDLPYDPAIPLLGIYLDKTIIQKDTCTPMFLATLVTIAKTWKQSKCPSIDE